jgi:hypothetical protein|tara:strand:- start:138 stop:635 length:498 start_codon:yes stop_codon:yes gene_type:complete
MRSLILTALFLIPLIGFASFPVKTTTPSDTIIESKKETMEEYKIRIQKQLKLTIETKKDTITENKNKSDKKLYNKPDDISSSKKFKILNILSLLFLVVGVVFAANFINYYRNPKTMNNPFTGVIYVLASVEILVYSIISFLLSIILFQIQKFINRRKIKKLKIEG